jgi:hypothetical protein
MADFNIDALAGQLMDIYVKAHAQTDTRDSELTTAAIEGKKRQRQKVIDEQWAKRQHALVQTTLTPLVLADKYSFWASAQGYELLDRALPLADVEELCKFMCDNTVAVTHERGWKGGWSYMLNRLPPLPPLLHSSFPFWCKYGDDGGANDVIRKWHGVVKSREERIKDGTLPAAAQNFQLYTTDEDVMKFNRKLVGLPGIPEYLPQARERSQKQMKEMEEMKMHQARRRECNDQRRFLAKSGGAVVDGKYAGPKWDRPCSPPKETRRDRRGLSEASMGFDNDSEEDDGYGVSRWGHQQATRARRGSIETTDGLDSNDRYAGFRWDGARPPRPPRPQYRPRRDSNEAVVGFGRESDRFALVSKSGKHRAEKDTVYFVPPARHTKHLEKEEDSVKESRGKVVRFSEDVEIRVIDG